MSPGGFELRERHTALDDADYTVHLDDMRRPDGAQMLIAHIRVHRWAPSVLKRMLREWKIFRSVCRSDIYASPQTDEPKWHKMVRAVGFEFLTQVICNDGLTRPLYISRTRDGHEYHHPTVAVLDDAVGPSGRGA